MAPAAMNHVTSAFSVWTYPSRHSKQTRLMMWPCWRRFSITMLWVIVLEHSMHMASVSRRTYVCLLHDLP